MKELVLILILVLITIGCFITVVYALLSYVKKLSRENVKLLKTNAQDRMAHQKELLDFRKKTEEDFLYKLSLINNGTFPEVLLGVGEPVPFLTIPIRHSEIIERYFYNRPFATVQQDEMVHLRPEKVQVSYLDERLNHERIQGLIINKVAEWMCRNGLVFGKLDRGNREITFSFYVYKK